MAVDMNLLKELREKTQAGIADCKKALEACGNDMAKAVDYLREKGLSTAVKKSGRIASEGVVESYIHGNGRIGVLIEVNCETDFVARNAVFKQFVKDMAMQIAASQPLYIAKEDVPQEALDREANVLKAQALNEGKPEKVVEKIVQGRMSKYYEDFCLLEQSFVKEPDLKVKDVLTQTIAKLNENIKIRRFVRYEMGEGLEKKEENFAEEVQKQLKG
ncbi:MAG: translation elongation factor Ts [Clostridia bacterium]|nr:translation elongation factor Ts [Clostridia bacterium]